MGVLSFVTKINNRSIYINEVFLIYLLSGKDYKFKKRFLYLDYKIYYKAGFYMSIKYLFNRDLILKL